jgi:hypothetical protein
VVGRLRKEGLLIWGRLYLIDIYCKQRVRDIPQIEAVLSLAYMNVQNQVFLFVRSSEIVNGCLNY